MTTYAEAQAAWIKAGGPADMAPTMAAIAQAESGLNAAIIQQGQPYATTGYGLWQITPGNSEPQCGVDGGLLNADANACAAVAKYKSQGVTAWTTYTSGAYKAFMGGNVTPAGGNAAPAGGGSATPPDAVAGNLTNGCAIGIPSISLGNVATGGLLSKVPFVGGMFSSATSTPEICIIRDSWLRAIFGAALLTSGAIVGAVGIAVLVKSMTGHNTGLKQAPGAVGDMFKRSADNVRRGESPNPDSESPASALMNAHTSGTYKSQPFKPETGRARAQGGSQGRNVQDPLTKEWSPGVAAPKRKTGSNGGGKLFTAPSAKGTAGKAGGKAAGGAASKAALSMDSIVSDAKLLAMVVPK